MWGIVTLASGILAIVSYMKYRDDEFEAGYMVIALVFLLVAVIGFIILITYGDALVAWIVSPTAKAIMTIMDKIK